MTTQNGFHIVRKSDNFELSRWSVIPARVEVMDGSVVVRVDGAAAGWNGGQYQIIATSWIVPDPAPVTTITWSTFVSRFTDTEYASLQKTINNQVTNGNGALARYLALAAVNGVDMSNPQTMTYKSQIVTAGLPTSPP